MAILSKELVALAILNAFCLVVQLLPVVSVPITSARSNVYLSRYQSISFGVFGLCDLNTEKCSEPKIGYPSVNNSLQVMTSGEAEDLGDVALPSNAVYTISKLLVVHVIAFGFSCLLFLVVLFLISLEYVEKIDRLKLSWFIRNPEAPHPLGVPGSSKSSPEQEEMIEMRDQGVSQTSKNTPGESGPQQLRKPRDISRYINMMLAFSMLSFICTLLGLLADILLFIPNLSYVGWLQLFPVIVLTLIAAMLCFVKRSISSRRYLELGHKYGNDDMRLRNSIIDSRWNDSVSDDGFYVYTNGFYSTQNNTAREPKLSHNANSSFDSGWIHHEYHNESNDDLSIRSHDPISEYSLQINDNERRQEELEEHLNAHRNT